MSNPDPNVFAQFMAQQAAQATPTPEQTTIPTPAVIAPTVNPALVDPTAAAQAAAYQAFLAQQQAPPVPAAPPGVDPAQYAAFLAAQQAPAAPVHAAPVTPVAAPAAAQFVAPPVNPYGTPSGGTDPFDDPAPPRPRGARLDDMAGRLLIIIPKGMDKGKSTEADGSVSSYDRMTADVVVLDGGPMPYGGKPNGRPPIPHDKVAEIPYRQTAMFISGTALISQARLAWEKRQRGEPGMVIGRLGWGEQPADPRFQAPWILLKATDADKDVARRYLATIDPFA